MNKLKLACDDLSALQKTSKDNICQSQFLILDLVLVSLRWYLYGSMYNLYIYIYAYILICMFNSSHCCSERLSFPDLCCRRSPVIQEFAAHFNLEKELANEASECSFDGK